VYSAKRNYLNRKDDNNWFRGSATLSHEMNDDETLMKAIEKNQYGKCVFKCDNDVVDHQVVNMEFEDDIIVSFTMSAFNLGGRSIRIMGTKGEIIANVSSPIIVYNNLITQKREEININDAVSSDSILSGHGGGDEGIMCALYDMLNGNADAAKLSNISVSVKNHKIVFAAEKSRIEGRVVDMSEI
jgi:predicted dehydrogenase